VPETLRRAVKRCTLRSRDVTNRLRYGRAAPRYAELIWVDPRHIQWALVGRSDYATCSGRVIDIDAELRRTSVHDTPRVRSSMARWVDGEPWERTADYRVMLDAIRAGKDWAGCRTEADLARRFAALDQLFDDTRSAGRLLARKELDPRAFREEGGILVCIGSGGEPLLYDGFHRFAIALILGLPVMPAQLGYVDRRAVGQLDRYRRPPGSRTVGGAAADGPRSR
jgi:hypothetical protein